MVREEVERKNIEVGCRSRGINSMKGSVAFRPSTCLLEGIVTSVLGCALGQVVRSFGSDETSEARTSGAQRGIRERKCVCVRRGFFS